MFVTGASSPCICPLAAEVMLCCLFFWFASTGSVVWNPLLLHTGLVAFAGVNCGCFTDPSSAPPVRRVSRWAVASPLPNLRLLTWLRRRWDLVAFWDLCNFYFSLAACSSGWYSSGSSLLFRCPPGLGSVHLLYMHVSGVFWFSL